MSVVIPVYRDWQRLALCLAALEAQSLAADLFEIIVAINEAEPACPLAAWPANLRFVHQPRPGSYAARNAGAAVARGTWLAFTDSDCIPDRDWLSRGMEALAAQPDARVTGPVTLFRPADATACAWLFEMHSAYPQRDYAAAGCCTTANLFVARSWFERIGPFDEQYSGGDFRWNARAQAAGMAIVYREEVAVAHPSRRSVAEIVARRRRFAGSACAHLPFHRFVARRLLSPLRRALKLRRSGLGRRDMLLVLAIQLLCDLAQIPEYALVRLGAKPPRRS